MAIKSYNDLYLSDVADNIGTMFEYATLCGYESKKFWSMFVCSEVAQQIEKGNPKYLSGYSGTDLVQIIINTKPVINRTKQGNLISDIAISNGGQYYWAGWALAQYQHKKGKSFYKINNILPIEKVLNLYPTLHEADITKFFDVADEYFKKTQKETNLKTIRTAAGLSQSELAKKAEVELRSIKMYEQRRNDINKAQVETLYKFAKVLGCNIEDLLED